jgi:hypothetical protein
MKVKGEALSPGETWYEVLQTFTQSVAMRARPNGEVYRRAAEERGRSFPVVSPSN